MFEQTLYEVVISLLADYIMGVAIVSDWVTFPLPSTVRRKACEFTYQAISVGLAKSQQIKLPEST